MTSTTSGQSAKQQFATQLSDLCRKADNQFASASTPVGQAAAVEGFITKVQTLKPPAAFTSTFSRWMSVIKQELADLKGGNTQGVYQLAHSKAKPLVKQMGAMGCVTGS